ncbi:MAG TPA: hypothetical protein ENN74_00715, partial [Firmicutes bacterium]|nr:hypothetical protein [Bacillota bacterium]
SVRIENGGTAAVAGLNDRRYRKNLQRVPFFWHIPLAGRLFENEAARGSERQVVVFITAHIMDESETGIQERFGRPPRIERVGADFKLELIEALEEMGAF